MAETKALIFDFGGVVAQRKGLYYIPIFPDDEMWHKAEKGEIPEEEFWKQLENYYHKTTEELVKTLFDEIGLNQLLIDFLNTIKSQYKLGIINNGLYQVLERAITEWKLKDVFEVILNSAKEKVSKPDPKIYLETCEKLGVSAEECIYITKKESYLETTQALGMRGFVYSDFTDFKNQILNIFHLGGGLR